MKLECDNWQCTGRYVKSSTISYSCVQTISYSDLKCSTVGTLAGSDIRYYDDNYCRSYTSKPYQPGYMRIDGAGFFSVGPLQIEEMKQGKSQTVGCGGPWKNEQTGIFDVCSSSCKRQEHKSEIYAECSEFKALSLEAACKGTIGCTFIEDPNCI